MEVLIFIKKEEKTGLIKARMHQRTIIEVVQKLREAKANSCELRATFPSIKGRQLYILTDVLLKYEDTIGVSRLCTEVSRAYN